MQYYCIDWDGCSCKHSEGDWAKREDIEKLLKQLPAPEKLELLADWLDMEQNNGRWNGGTEVQDDLRKWAKAIKKHQTNNNDNKNLYQQFYNEKESYIDEVCNNHKGGNK